jgi:hypothetical protein
MNVDRLSSAIQLLFDWASAVTLPHVITCVRAVQSLDWGPTIDHCHTG